jgi:AcrR family transcriptional regulator
LRSKRDDLVDTALRLFYTQGFNATGIDKILAESGVSKMTMYKHFKSKDELILAALTKRDEQFRDWLTSSMEKAASAPHEKLLAMFDALEDWFYGRAFKGMGFAGCAFINASSEFSQLDHPAHKIAADHKRCVLEYIRTLCEDAGAANPAELAEQIALLKEGAIVTAQVRGMPDAAKIAKSVAQSLLDQALAD